QSLAGRVERGGIDRMRRAVEHAGQAIYRAGRVELCGAVGAAHRIEFERKGSEEEQDEQQGEDAERPWRGGAYRLVRRRQVVDVHGHWAPSPRRVWRRG